MWQARDWKGKQWSGVDLQQFQINDRSGIDLQHFSNEWQVSIVLQQFQMNEMQYCVVSLNEDSPSVRYITSNH